MWRVRDCKIIIFFVRIQKRGKDNVVGQKTIKLWKWSGDTGIAYKEREREIDREREKEREIDRERERGRERER